MSEVPTPDISEEPFACPACGQMLAPTIRVCVVCKQPIDPAQIKRPALEPPPVEVHPSPVVPRARFSWPIFLSVLVVWLLAAAISQRLLGYMKSQLALGSAVVLSSIWVFLDAERKAVPKPLRWGIGSLLLWILVFPWYLARRRSPQAACPFVEGEVGPITRALFFILVTFFLLGAILIIVKGPSAR